MLLIYWAALDIMVPTGKGAVVLTESMSGMIARSACPASCTSKAAVNHAAFPACDDTSHINGQCFVIGVGYALV